MLEISAEQEDALARAQRAEFVFETVDVFRSLAPGYLEGLDDEAAARAVGRTMLQAEAYGFTTGRQIRRYMALEAHAGRGFDQGNRFPELLALFHDTTADPDERLTRAETIVTRVVSPVQAA